MNTVIFTIVAYLIGSISFAVVMSRAFGLSDPRTYGSKNPGATNVLRSGNKKAAIATLIGDGAKGWLAVWLAQRFAEQYGVGDLGIALVAIAVFLGHLYPVFFRFVGGKGVATALGVLLGLNVWIGVATLVTWLVIAYAFRYSSLAALIAAIFAPFYYGMAVRHRSPGAIARGPGHERAAGHASSRQYCQPDGRQGKSHRQQGRRGRWQDQKEVDRDVVFRQGLE